MKPDKHTPEGAALTELFLTLFPFYGLLNASGEQLAAHVGLTVTRWQVLSALARADKPETVSCVARSMGLTRQAVQRTADLLVAEGLIGYEANPQHRRAALLRVSAEGRKRFQAISRLQVPWVNGLADRLEVDDIKTATAVINKVRLALSLTVKT